MGARGGVVVLDRESGGRDGLLLRDTAEDPLESLVDVWPNPRRCPRRASPLRGGGGRVARAGRPSEAIPLAYAGLFAARILAAIHPGKRFVTVAISRKVSDAVREPVKHHLVTLLGRQHDSS